MDHRPEPRFLLGFAPPPQAVSSTEAGTADKVPSPSQPV